MCEELHETTTIEEAADVSPNTCLNCGTELNGEYCHVCGQQAGKSNSTVRGFIMEYVNNAFIWDPQHLKTIWLLVRKPGFLTTEFISGRYVSYAHPIKLNMFILFVFITVFLLFSSQEKLNHSVSDVINDVRVVSTLQMEMLMEDQAYAEKMSSCPRDTVQLLAPLLWEETCPGMITCLDVAEDTKGESLDKWTAIVPTVLVEDSFLIPATDGYYHFNKDAGSSSSDVMIFIAVWEQLIDLMTRYFPMIVLLTAPILSFSLRMVHRKNRQPRINSFIFSLHYTAFLELLILFIYFIYLVIAPPIAVLEWVLAISSCVYLTMAYRRVYETDSWFKAFARSMFTSVLYFLILMMLLICNFFISCIMVAFHMI